MRVAVLVDEAHNLVERGRKMYSAELQGNSVRRHPWPGSLAQSPA